MVLLYLQLCLLFIGAISALSLRKNTPFASRYCATVTGIASFLGLTLAFWVLISDHATSAVIPISLPLGRAVLALDPLAAFFLVPVNFLGAIGSLLIVRCQHPESAGYNWAFCFFFSLLLLSLTLVITAADGFFFLLLWEIMSLCPFFLMRAKDKKSKGPWLYLIMAHLGALPLFMLFTVMAAECGSTEFSAFISHAVATGWTLPSLLFFMALLGFGAKMGLFPLHGWMPEAYPTLSAPAIVVISGAMVNVGIYGLLRSLDLIHTAEMWWGISLMGIGGLTGLVGICFAFVQPDIKRVLAYSSSENMGIICLALGAAILSVFTGDSISLAFFTGGMLLHIWNHSIFKSLLFLGADTIYLATGTTAISNLGGLGKKMPRTAMPFALGCVAIAAVPPFNGFVGELLLFMGFVFTAKVDFFTESVILCWVGLFALGTIGGFALLCFTRLYGLVFSGNPRNSSVPTKISETPELITRNRLLTFMAATCFICGLAAPAIYMLLAPVQNFLVLRLGKPAYLPQDMYGTEYVFTVLLWTAGVLAAFLLLCALVYRWHKRLPAVKKARAGITWDCAYAAPQARMQYTGGSFSFTGLLALRHVLHPKCSIPVIKSLFPEQMQASIVADDWTITKWGAYIFTVIAIIARKAKILQHGLVNSYILYILIALIGTLVWAMWGI